MLLRRRLQVSALLGILLASVRYKHVLRILHIIWCFGPKPPTPDFLGSTCLSIRAFVVVPRISIRCLLTLMLVDLEIVEGSLWTSQSRQSQYPSLDQAGLPVCDRRVPPPETEVS